MVINQLRTMGDSQEIKVTFAGSIVNIILSIVKLIFGIYGKSQALIADAVHSISDLASDIVVILGIYFGALPPDQDHHYGHKKIETTTEIVLGIILIAVALKLGYDSVVALIAKDFDKPEGITIYAAAVSIIGKELLYQWTKRVAVRYDNRLIMANAWHHRSDAISSVAVLIGLVATQISSSLVFMDRLAGLIVSVLILKVGWEVAIEGYKKIIDTAPPRDFFNQVLRLIKDVPGAENPHNLRMRYIGNAIHIEVHIEVDQQITVSEGHDIAAEVKYKLKNHDSKISDVIVHVEPLEPPPEQ